MRTNSICLVIWRIDPRPGEPAEYPNDGFAESKLRLLNEFLLPRNWQRWFEAPGEDPRHRRVMMVMTLGWGIALAAQSAACVALVFALAIKSYLIVGPIVGYAVLGAMTAWSFWYARRRIASLMWEAEHSQAQLS